jgi:hypothetical protein
MNCRIFFLLSGAFLFGVGCGDTKTSKAVSNIDASPGTGNGDGRGGPSAPPPEPTSTSQPQSDAAPPIEPQVDSGVAPNSGLPQKPGAIPPGGMPPVGPVVCSRETTGLDLAQFLPVATVPAAFATAWKQEYQASAAPPLVLGLRNLTRGPVAASLGPVRSMSPTTWRFESPPLTARTVPVQVDPANQLHIKIPILSTTAISSFGDSAGRRGFSITGFAFDGILAGQCESVVGTMKFFIPGSNAEQPFGGKTVGALLGRVDVDSDADGMPDSWAVAFAGTAKFVNVESGP